MFNFRTITGGKFDLHLGVAAAIKDYIPQGKKVDLVYRGEVDGVEVQHHVTLDNTTDVTKWYESAVSDYGAVNHAALWDGLTVTCEGKSWPILFDVVTNDGLKTGVKGTHYCSESFDLGRTTFSLSEDKGLFDTVRSFNNFILSDGALHGPLLVGLSRRVLYRDPVTGENRYVHVGFVGDKSSTNVPTFARNNVAYLEFVRDCDNVHTTSLHPCELVQGVSHKHNAGAHIDSDAYVFGVILSAWAAGKKGEDFVKLDRLTATVDGLLAKHGIEVHLDESGHYVVRCADDCGCDTTIGKSNVVVRRRGNGAIRAFNSDFQLLSSDDPVTILLQCLHVDEDVHFVCGEDYLLYSTSHANYSCRVMALAFNLMHNIFGGEYNAFKHFLALAMLLMSRCITIGDSVVDATGNKRQVYSYDGRMVIRADSGDKVGPHFYASTNRQLDEAGSAKMATTGRAGVEMLRGSTAYSLRVDKGDTNLMVHMLRTRDESLAKEGFPFVWLRPNSYEGEPIGEGPHAVVCVRDAAGRNVVVYDSLGALSGRVFDPAKCVYDEEDSWDGYYHVCYAVRANVGQSLVSCGDGSAYKRADIECINIGGYDA